MHSSDQTPHNQPAATATQPTASRLAELRAWWDEAWAKDGVLHEKWEDLRQAPELGWHLMANWVKAGLSLLGISFAIIIVTTAIGTVAETLDRLLAAAPTVRGGVDTSGGVWGVIDNPLRQYIAAHSAGLPISASTVYTLWQLTGLFCLITGFITRSNGVRLTWTAWGAASIAAVWATTPETSRTIATAIAVLAWTLASALALRGLNLRPRVFATIHNPVDVRPEIHIPAQPDHADPDNVRPLHR